MNWTLEGQIRRMRLQDTKLIGSGSDAQFIARCERSRKNTFKRMISWTRSYLWSCIHHAVKVAEVVFCYNCSVMVIAFMRAIGTKHGSV